MAGNYYRFWLINEQGLYIIDHKYQRQKVITKSDEDKLIAELYNDPHLERDNTAILHKNLPSYAFSRLYYQKYKKDDFLNAYKIFERGLCLPNSTMNSIDEIYYVSSIIKEFL